MSKIYKGEQGYLDMLSDVLTDGVEVVDPRTGVKTLAMFDAKWTLDDDNTFPFSTVRPAGLRLAFEEMWFFLNGKTQTKELEDKGIMFWHPQTRRSFLDSRDLYCDPEGSLVRAYSKQFRDFGGYHTCIPVDQLKKVYNILSDEECRYSRRAYITLWNPLEEYLMPLTPCWHSHQYVVLPNKQGEDELHLKVLNRSLDTCFGFSFAVQQYRLYQMAMAKLCGLKLGNMSCDLSQVHIYENQIEYVKELLQRDLGKTGTVSINKDLNSLESLLGLVWDDIEVEGLELNKEPFKTPRPEMIA